MAIPDGHMNNLETLRRAFSNEDVALVECNDASTGEIVIAICAITIDKKSGDSRIVPLARMFNGNPFEELIPPR